MVAGARLPVGSNCHVAAKGRHVETLRWAREHRGFECSESEEESLEEARNERNQLILRF